jgi:hypothetical protein
MLSHRLTTQSPFPTRTPSTGSLEKLQRAAWLVAKDGAAKSAALAVRYIKSNGNGLKLCPTQSQPSEFMQCMPIAALGPQAVRHKMDVRPTLFTNTSDDLPMPF